MPAGQSPVKLLRRGGAAGCRCRRRPATVITCAGAGALLRSARSARSARPRPSPAAARPCRRCTSACCCGGLPAGCRRRAGRPRRRRRRGRRRRPAAARRAGTLLIGRPPLAALQAVALIGGQRRAAARALPARVPLADGVSLRSIRWTGWLPSRPFRWRPGSGHGRWRRAGSSAQMVEAASRRGVIDLVKATLPRARTARRSCSRDRHRRDDRSQQPPSGERLRSAHRLAPSSGRRRRASEAAVQRPPRARASAATKARSLPAPGRGNGQFLTYYIRLYSARSLGRARTARDEARSPRNLRSTRRVDRPQPIAPRVGCTGRSAGSRGRSGARAS